MGPCTNDVCCIFRVFTLFLLVPNQRNPSSSHPLCLPTPSPPPRADIIFTSPPCLPSPSVSVDACLARRLQPRREPTAFGVWARKRLQQAAVGMRTVQRIPLPFLPSPFLGWPRARDDDDRHILSYFARARWSPPPHRTVPRSLARPPDPNLGRNEGGREREKENVCEEH